MISSAGITRGSLILLSVAAVAGGLRLQWETSAAAVHAVVAEPGGTFVAPQKKDDEPALRSFMRQKLDASNRILEGLVTDDMNMIESGADTLLKMSTEAKWRASNDMLYRRYSTEFVDAVGDIREKAKAQSIDGASLAWINATMTCLKCHEWVRNTIIADLK